MLVPDASAAVLWWYCGIGGDRGGGRGSCRDGGKIACGGSRCGRRGAGAGAGTAAAAAAADPSADAGTGVGAGAGADSPVPVLVLLAIVGHDFSIESALERCYG